MQCVINQRQTFLIFPLFLTYASNCNLPLLQYHIIEGKATMWLKYCEVRFLSYTSGSPLISKIRSLIPVMLISVISKISLFNILLFCVFQGYGFPVNQLFDMVLEMRDQYGEILLKKWNQSFRWERSTICFLLASLWVIFWLPYSHILNMTLSPFFLVNCQMHFECSVQ